jgi:hypothetical protein
VILFPWFFTGLDQQQHERFINIIEENVAIKAQVAVVQDLSHLDASTSTRKLNVRKVFQLQEISSFKLI